MKDDLTYQVEGFSPLVVTEAKTFWGRFLGLMGRQKLPMDRGLLISPCNSIHMCFMRFSIDAIYFAEDGTILKVVKNLYPWIGMSMCFKAVSVLEVTAGSAERHGFFVGNKPCVSLVAKA